MAAGASFSALELVPLMVRWVRAYHHAKIEAQAEFGPCSQPLEPSSPNFAAVCGLTVVSKILNYHSANYLIVVSSGDRHDVEGVRAAQELPAEADRE
jgi:nitric oxide reductase large subunit